MPEFGLFLFVQLCYFSFKLVADNNHYRIFFLCNFPDHVKMGIIFKALFIHIGNIENGLHGQKMQIIDVFSLFLGKFERSGSIATINVCL